MKHRHFFLLVPIFFASFFWLFESSLHHWAFGEPEFEFIPTDLNELWKRTTIFCLLVGFGIFADYHTRRILKKDEEKKEVFKAMVAASHHILNNFLANMTLFRSAAEESRDFDQEILALYDEVIDDAASQVRRLVDIQEPDRTKIEKRYKPAQTQALPRVGTHS